MRILADFTLESDLCLPQGHDPIVIHNQPRNTTLTLSNSPLGTDHQAVLSAQVEFDVDDFANARDGAFVEVAEFMNSLTYATNRSFGKPKLAKVVDWTPGLQDRHAVIFQESPLDDRSEPALTAVFGETASKLLSIQSHDALPSALRWYRLGIGSRNLEEQFSYFWFALEITAEALKRPDRATDNCPRCRRPLYCENCQDHPTHRPYPAQAIKQLVERVVTGDAAEVFEVLQKIRHTLMHGARIDSIASELPCTPAQATHKLANVTWQALCLMFDKEKLAPGVQLAFGYVDSVVRHTVIAGVTIVARLPLDREGQPQLTGFPQTQIEIQHLPRTGNPRDPS